MSQQMRHRAQNGIPYAPVIPTMDFLAPAEKTLEQVIAIGATQAIDGRELELEGNDCTFIGLYVTPASASYRPEMRSIRREKPFKVLAGLAGSGSAMFACMDSLFAHDYQSLAMMAGKEPSDIRLALALPYGLVAGGNISILDSRLDAFYERIARNPRLSAALAATVAESAMRDVHELGERLLDRARSRFQAPKMIGAIDEETPMVAAEVMARAIDKVICAKLISASGATPAQCLSQLATRPETALARNPHYAYRIAHLPLELITRPKEWRQELLGEAAVMMAASTPAISREDLVEFRNCFTEMTSTLSMPLRPETFAKGYIYAETGAHTIAAEVVDMLVDQANPLYHQETVVLEHYQSNSAARRKPTIEGPAPVTHDLFAESLATAQVKTAPSKGPAQATESTQEPPEERPLSVESQLTLWS